MRGGGRDARNQLVVLYTDLVDSVAKRLAGHFRGAVEEGDLFNSGVIGLIDAIEKFETGRGIRFESYAGARIQGAILDGLRDADWVPKRVRAKARDIEAATERIESDGRAVSDDDLAEEMGLTAGEVRAAIAHAHTVDKVSINRVNGEDITDTLPGGGDDPGDVYEVTALCRLVADAIAAIPERERVVLALHYREALTSEQIGDRLGVGPTRVNQVKTAGLTSLRDRLGGKLTATEGTS